TADYCGLQILTYAILSNLFHVLVRVPPPRKFPTPNSCAATARCIPNPDFGHNRKNHLELKP
ncbi:MAG: hypothetical protein LBI02_06590, partial [Opitutaceae bacterium]|nr:hypothetical protein [Opitutaceae bacterium]